MTTFADWMAAFRRRDVVKRSAVISVIVGSTLVAINQGDALLASTLPKSLFWKVPLTFLVPYCVSSFASAQTIVSGRK